ncbi:hypothetical protein ABTD96_19500, partial [Acinetobacter baumannii]
ADGGGAVTAATASGTVDIAIGITGGSAVNVKVDMKGNETAEQAAAKIAAAVNDANVGIGAFSDGDTISYVSKAGKDGSGAITSAVSGVVIA